MLKLTLDYWLQTQLQVLLKNTPNPKTASMTNNQTNPHHTETNISKTSKFWALQKKYFLLLARRFTRQKKIYCLLFWKSCIFYGFQVFQNKYLEDICLSNCCLVLLSKPMLSFQNKKPTKAEGGGCSQPILTANATVFHPRQSGSSLQGKPRTQMMGK